MAKSTPKHRKGNEPHKRKEPSASTGKAARIAASKQSETSEQSKVSQHAEKPTSKASQQAKTSKQSEAARRTETAKPKRKASKKPLIAIAAVAVAVIALIGGIWLANSGSTESSGAAITDFDTTNVPDIGFADSSMNPIDFDSLISQNKDIYAWLYVPGTEVNLPVLQSALADNYYLYHNVYGDDDITGAPYTQSLNSKRFTDPVTVIYGHTFQPGEEMADAAFGTLHNYEDAEFMEEHPEFYIYTPEWMLTYKVVSAYTYDNRHILNTMDLSDQSVRQEYYDSVVAPDGDVAVVSDVESLDAGRDRIVQLSTCTRPADDERRFIVTGVLRDRVDLEPSWK